MTKRAPDKLLKAFADETRLRILSLLSSGEMCVCDVMAVLGAPQPRVSRHLAYLRAHGLVQARRDGTWVYYSLAKPATGFHKRLVGCLDCCLDEAPIFQADRKALAKLARRPARC
ncbi:MAG: winged helix-turn-helix transcriptional regulator [Elusimicrobia bacterium]|nr:winged helix-turn-helix transcriptional regulator [Elusimicrobiota bacterium]